MINIKLFYLIKTNISWYTYVPINNIFEQSFLFDICNQLIQQLLSIGLLLNCLQGLAIISMKSIVNKIIPAEELGNEVDDKLIISISINNRIVLQSICLRFGNYLFSRRPSNRSDEHRRKRRAHHLWTDL